MSSNMIPIVSLGIAALSLVVSYFSFRRNGKNWEATCAVEIHRLKEHALVFLYKLLSLTEENLKENFFLIYSDFNKLFSEKRSFINTKESPYFIKILALSKSHYNHLSHPSNNGCGQNPYYMEIRNALKDLVEYFGLNLSDDDTIDFYFVSKLVKKIESE